MAATEHRGARTALLASLALAWLNLLLTARWAHVPGSINGPKYPFYVMVLSIASILAWRATAVRVEMTGAARVVCAACVAFLGYAFFVWFPLETWDLIPFLDDWPPRYQSTVEGVRLLRDGVLSGWRWSFLGGYAIATDVTQDLAVWAAIPMRLFGPAVGFHALHLLLFAAIPLLVWADLRIAREPADVTVLASGLAALFSTNYSYFLIRSGDTNSLTGVVAATATLVAAHAARHGLRGATPAMLLALTLTNHSHRGFFVYVVCFLALDAVLARDWRSAARAGIAAAAAVIASLPLTWDLWRYPSYYIVNNVELHPAAFDWRDFARKVYYNVEILTRPGRWFNDYTGLTNVFLPVVAFTAWQGRGRIRFFALATLGVVALVRLNYGAFGYAFLRPLHLLPVFIAPVLASFVLRGTGRRPLAFAVLATLALYLQVWLVAVPHVRSVRDFDAALIDRIASLDGHLVLLENAFHRDADTSAHRESPPTPFGVHYEALVPEATGRRLYAGMWDGWQWTPARDQVFANGTFRGRALADVPVPDVQSELRRWGVRHLMVWSEPAKIYLNAAAGFSLQWQTDRWQHWMLQDVDTRAVILDRGSAVLERPTPSGADVRLSGVHRGATVTVRTNYHPAWQARSGDLRIGLMNVDGQLAFIAPADGDYVVQLEYPKRRWLLLVAVAAFTAGWLTMRSIGSAKAA